MGMLTCCEFEIVHTLEVSQALELYKQIICAQPAEIYGITAKSIDGQLLFSNDRNSYFLSLHDQRSKFQQRKYQTLNATSIEQRCFTIHHVKEPIHPLILDNMCGYRKTQVFNRDLSLRIERREHCYVATMCVAGTEMKRMSSIMHEIIGQEQKEYAELLPNHQDSVN